MTATTREALVAHLAEELTSARLQRAPVAPLTERHPELTIEDAYAIQEATARERIAAGGKVVGQKVGLTSKAMQEMLGVAEPDFGRIYADEVHESGGAIDVGRYIAPRVEPEITFIMARALRGAEVTAADVLAATAAVVGSLEVIDSRVADWKIKLVDTVADNASGAGIVVGPLRTAPFDVDLAAAKVTLSVDGGVLQEGLGSAVLGHPAEAVAWLVRTLDGFGGGLAAGDLVMPGSMTAAVPLAEGQHVVADFGPLGVVEAVAR